MYVWEKKKKNPTNVNKPLNAARPHGKYRQPLHLRLPIKVDASEVKMCFSPPASVGLQSAASFSASQIFPQSPAHFTTDNRMAKDNSGPKIFQFSKFCLILSSAPSFHFNILEFWGVFSLFYANLNISQRAAVFFSISTWLSFIT